MLGASGCGRAGTVCGAPHEQGPAVVVQDHNRQNLSSTVLAYSAYFMFDRQIVAIAKVARATAVYADDADVRSMAAAQDIAVIGLVELPLPPVDPQMAMQFAPPTPAQEEPPGEPDEDIEAPEDEPNDGAEQEPG